MKLITGPAGSGKTAHLLQIAQAATRAGKRVWWVGLPHQRAHVMRRLTSLAGVVMGFEFMSTQQLYTRLISDNSHLLALLPPLPNTERIAMVGGAIAEINQGTPGPGEAKLFAASIAELKRHNLTPDDIPTSDPETDLLKQVFQTYERLRQDVRGQGEFWDYDDYRIQAAKLLNKRKPITVAADLVIFDGFRTYTPLELTILKRLAKRAEVLASAIILPEKAPKPKARFDERPTNRHVYRADNPIEELRFVLRSVKQDLANGMDPLEVGIIAPEGDHPFIETLAQEYGVPLMPSVPTKLSQTAAGALLMDLLTFVENPSPSKLERLPELYDLAVTARRENMTGMDGIALVAQHLDLTKELNAWVERLSPPDQAADAEAWALDLIDSLPGIDAGATRVGWETLRELMARHAREATHLGGGKSYRDWFASLLDDSPVPAIHNGAVQLLTAVPASGVQFQKAYLTSAMTGAYTLGEGEDYFVPEEWRGDLPSDKHSRRPFLPRRFAGMETVLHQELRSRAAEMIVTFSAADQNARNFAEPDLVGNPSDAQPLPSTPAGSPVELYGYQPFEPVGEFPEDQLPTSVEGLRSFQECPVKYWGQQNLPRDDEEPWWVALVRDMRNMEDTADEQAVKNVAGRNSIARDWLLANAGELGQYKYGVSIPKDPDGPESSYVHAAHMDTTRGVATLLRFVEPGRVTSDREANSLIYDRWNELWAAAYLLKHYGNILHRVDIKVWPILGEPYLGRKVTSNDRVAVERLQKARSAVGALKQPSFEPKPGHYCRVCDFAKVCRKDAR